MTLIRMDNNGKLLRASDEERLIRTDNQGRLIGGPPHPAQHAVPTWRSVLLLLDVSPSMADDNKFPYAREGAMRFAVSALEKHSRPGLIVFGGEASLLITPTSDMGAFKRALDSTSVEMMGEGTNMARALWLAASTPDISTVVLVTDGYPTCATDEALYYARELRKREIDIITIGTEDADRRFLSKLATRKDLAIQTQTSHIQNAISDASHLLSC